MRHLIFISSLLTLDIHIFAFKKHFDHIFSVGSQLTGGEGLRKWRERSDRHQESGGSITPPFALSPLPVSKKKSVVLIQLFFIIIFITINNLRLAESFSAGLGGLCSFASRSCCAYRHNWVMSLLEIEPAPPYSLLSPYSFS